MVDITILGWVTNQLITRGGGTTLWLQCVHMLQLSGAYARTGGGYDCMMHI
jgi:hypothetical protein